MSAEIPAGADPQRVLGRGAPLVLSRPSTNTLLLLAIVLLVSAWPFLEALQWLWRWWIDSPEYSHGILIPALAAFLIYVRRDQLAEHPFVGSWLGVVLVGLAGLVYWFGRLATLHVVDNVGYWLLLCGLALALLGRRSFRVIAVPIGLLLLAIPLPVFFLNNISATLQLWSSKLGVAFIRMFGISVYLQGNVIDLGPYRLEVAEACSGLRYLFPLLTLGVLMAYLYRGATWKRVLIALSSLPLTVLMNSLRIGSIGVMVEHWGTGLAEGFVHDFQGWAMFMVTGVLMFAMLVALHRYGGQKETWREAFGIPLPVERPPGTVVRITPVPPAFLAAVALVVVIACIGQWAPAVVDVIPARASFVSFPDQFGSWTGRRQGLDSATIDVLQLDDYLMADYVSGDGKSVNLYVAYYNAQRTGQSVHSPRSCLPGGGWVMTEFGQRDLPGLAPNGRLLSVNRAIVELGKDRQLVYYWFQQRGRTITSEFGVKWYLLWDGLTRHRTDGALVRLVVPLAPGTSVDDADQALQRFAGELGKVLPAYVPD